MLEELVLAIGQWWDIKPKWTGNFTNVTGSSHCTTPLIFTEFPRALQSIKLNGHAPDYASLEAIFKNYPEVRYNITNSHKREQFTWTQ